jgi:5-formyltetrahydrofolate cyclo-ligase
MSELTALKSALRKEAATVRKSVHDTTSEYAKLRLCEMKFPLSPSAECNIVSAFYPYQSEIDARPLLAKLAGDGWTPCLPIVVARDQPLIFRRWYPGQRTVPGKWNIPQPDDDQPLLEPDVLLIPMLAFDRDGYRLGYGGGFYDRTLATLRARKPITAIGVAYAAQEVPHVPRGPLDQPIDFIMTEMEVISIPPA